MLLNFWLEVWGDFVRRTRERMQPRGSVERLERGWWYIHGLINQSLGNIVRIIDSRRSVSTSVITAGENIRVLGRTRFEAGEVGALKSIFDKYATSSVLKFQLPLPVRETIKIKFSLRVSSIPSRRLQDMKLSHVRSSNMCLKKLDSVTKKLWIGKSFWKFVVV